MFVPGIHFVLSLSRLVNRFESKKKKEINKRKEKEKRKKKEKEKKTWTRLTKFLLFIFVLAKNSLKRNFHDSTGSKFQILEILVEYSKTNFLEFNSYKVEITRANGQNW